MLCLGVSVCSTCYNLARQWKIRAKYVDDLSVVEIISRCSTSFLPFIAKIFPPMLVSMACALTQCSARRCLLIFYTISGTILLSCSFLSPKSSASTRISCLVCRLLIIYVGACTASTFFRERANACMYCVV